MPDVRIIKSETLKRVQPKPNPQKAVAKLLASDFVYASTMLCVCYDLWGHDLDDNKVPKFLSWHPGTLRMELDQTFGIDMPKGNFDRLMAGIAILTTDMFFKNVNRFIQLCNILAGDVFEPGEFDTADAGECAWGITEALMLVPPDEDDPEPFTPEIRHYVGKVLHEEGFVTAPDILGIALGFDASNHVRVNFGHDASLMTSIHAEHKRKAGEIEKIIREGVVDLLNQIKGLHLRNGETKELETRLGAMLKRV